jgi:ADP-L-glycero-D-manno-heptose 6-epimerase
MWNYCCSNKIPLVYASSAATYGNGEFGYDDDHSIVEKLQPLNPYGFSKNEVDKWALEQANLKYQPPFWAALKFFNVYGPNESHKNRMASVIYHSYWQIKQNGYVKLFKSYQHKFADGEQLRDFIYVKDVVKICYWLMDTVSLKNEKINSGIYNVGTGKARSFNDLVKSVYAALEISVDIRYIDMPGDIKEKYQYYTQANINKIVAAGYTGPLYSLKDGVNDYVKNYLVKKEYY